MLLFKDAFLNTIAIPILMRRCIVATTETCMTLGGQYNVLAAAVYQCLLSDEDYKARIIHLISSDKSSIT